MVLRSLLVQMRISTSLHPSQKRAASWTLLRPLPLKGTSLRPRFLYQPQLWRDYRLRRNSSSLEQSLEYVRYSCDRAVAKLVPARIDSRTETWLRYENTITSALSMFSRFASCRSMVISITWGPSMTYELGRYCASILHVLTYEGKRPECNSKRLVQ